jgi:hypothetical protein
MDSSVVNTIIARCLLDAGFLERMALDPSAALEGYALDARTRADFLVLNTDKIRNFAGFITKVQHNYLWESFPYTRALLKLYKIEIEVFVAYLPMHQCIRAEGRATKDQKIESFVAFLLAYLDSQEHSQYPGLREILLHERILWEIGITLGAGKPPEPPASAIEIASLRPHQWGSVVPMVRGALRVGNFMYDPWQIIEYLTQKHFALHQIPMQRRYLSYWADSATNQLRILELDDISAALLSQVDGRRAIRTIVRQVTKNIHGRVRLAQFWPFFQAAFDQGLLTVHPDYQRT